MKIRSHPFNPLNPFCHPVAFCKKRRSLNNAKRVKRRDRRIVVVNESSSEAAL